MIFTCNATGQPQPEITWSKSEGALPVSRTIIQDAKLTILNAAVNESGLYVCTATNAAGSNSSVVELNVVRLSDVSDVTVETSISLYVYIGQTKTIQCPVTTDSNSSVQWLYHEAFALPDGVLIEGPKDLKITSAEMRHGGIYTCVVRNSSSSTQTAANVTIHVTYPETCSRVISDIGNVSGHYVIDPDGANGTAPFEVYCNMTDKGSVGVTVVGHDTENRTHVNGCQSDGCYKRDVSYIGTSLPQLTALTDVSTHCEQFISYECKKSQLLGNGKAWWVSRDGIKKEYWGGATNMNGYCACGVTKTCANKEKCNCDANGEVWREDSGLLTDKSSLPVSQLRFGDTGKEWEEGYHILGKLKCHGISL